jgi:hypothetical protein
MEWFDQNPLGQVSAQSGIARGVADHQSVI